MGTYYYGETVQALEIIWIDARVNDTENLEYKEDILKFMTVNFSCFENVPDAIEYLKKLEFVSPYIITSGRLYPEFIKEFKSKINEFSICPKIIIFCGNAKSYLKKNKNNDLPLNHPFYNIGGVKDSFDEIKEFLLKKEESTPIELSSHEIKPYLEDDKLYFEYISNQNQLILPLFFPLYISKPQEEKIKEFNELSLKYYSQVPEIKPLFEQLIGVKNIPYEILYNYWIKAFLFDTNFRKDIIEETKSDNLEKYLVFIQTLYKGFQANKKLLEIQDETNLYRYSTLSKAKLDNMNIILSKNETNLPKILIYSKNFISFYSDEKDAKDNINNKNDNNILFIIGNAKTNLNLCNGYTNIESSYKNSKKNEIIFYPFLFFEIIKIVKESDNNYKIYLGSLGKYENLFKEEDKKLLPEKIPEESAITNDFFNLNLIDDEYKDIYSIITIKYQVISLYKKIQIFGKDFVKNNKDKCYMIIDGQKSEIKEEFVLNNENKNLKELIVKLAGLNKINNISHIFNGCKHLINLPDMSKIDTKNITNMSSMFRYCSNIKSLPDLSKWNTKNVTDMSYLFAKCSSIVKLPDISRWDTSNVTNMHSLFDSCTSISILPDISKWEMGKVNDISFMFYDLPNLESFPELSKWNVNNVTNMGSLFEKCSKIVSLPDISKWNVKKVENISSMFYLCTNLKSLPDISKWTIQNSTNLEYTFFGLQDSIIPDKFKNKKK